MQGRPVEPEKTAPMTRENSSGGRGASGVGSAWRSEPQQRPPDEGLLLWRHFPPPGKTLDAISPANWRLPVVHHLTGFALVQSLFRFPALPPSRSPVLPPPRSSAFPPFRPPQKPASRRYAPCSRASRPPTGDCPSPAILPLLASNRLPALPPSPKTRLAPLRPPFSRARRLRSILRAPWPLHAPWTGQAGAKCQIGSDHTADILAPVSHRHRNRHRNRIRGQKRLR